MNIKIAILIVSVALHNMSCNNEIYENIHISQLEVNHLHELSSASGIFIHQHNIYIVGDDTPWLYKLDSNFHITDKILISGITTLFAGRTPKYLKSDFESLEIISENGNFEIVIISSGSIPQTRDTAFILSLSDTGIIYSNSLRPLYKKIKTAAKLSKTSEINIEGIAFSEDDAYLFHRGNVSENIIIRIKRKDFISYIKNNNTIPVFEIYRINLPVYKGITSGFSGACLNPINLD